MKTLIVYASKYGTTTKCVQLLNNNLNVKADVMNFKEKREIDLSNYETIIIGGSIYIGRIRKEVSQFCSKNLEQLKEKKVGLFICGMLEGEAIETEFKNNFPPALYDHAKVKSYFGGEFIFDKMNRFEKMVIKKVSKVTTNQSSINEPNIMDFATVLNSL